MSLESGGRPPLKCFSKNELMKYKLPLAILCSSLFASVYISGASAQDVPQDYQEVLALLGKKGDYKDKVLKVNIPRNDLKVTVAGVQTPTPFGFGGWLAMTKGDNDNEVAM